LFSQKRGDGKGKYIAKVQEAAWGRGYAGFLEMTYSWNHFSVLIGKQKYGALSKHFYVFT